MVELDDSRPVLVAVRNEDAANLAGIIATAIDYKDAVNSDTFYGASAGDVKMGLIQTGEPQFENGVSFYSIRYEFQFRERRHPSIPAWDLDFLDEGFHAQTTSGNSPAARGTKYEIKPGCAKASGLKAGGLVRGPTDPPHFVQFQVYPNRPFGALGL